MVSIDPAAASVNTRSPLPSMAGTWPAVPAATTIGGAGGVPSALAGGSVGQSLRIGAGGLPEWTTPASGVTEFFALSDTPATGAASGNQLMASNAAGTALTGLQLTRGALLTGNAGSAPTILSAGTTGQVPRIQANGDLAYED
ncbi:MAG: hypothetical protein AAFP86_08055, partial [Planctomycetota bacterium]